VRQAGAGRPGRRHWIGGEEGLNGLRVDGESVEAVAEGLARLLRDPELAGRMGRAGRERTVARFTSDQRAELIRRLIVGG